MDGRGPAYWAVIPADVRYDDKLPANAKLLYGEISSLCDQRGYCYATNAYFSKLYGWSTATIQRLLSALNKQGYIQVDIVRDRRTKEVSERRIYAGLQMGVTPPLKNEGRSPQKKGDPPLKNDLPIKEEQYKENISPLTPQGGDETKKRKKRDPSIPKWKPEAFERWWTYYRTHVRGEDRVGAVKAWDKLRPDDALIKTMGLALMAQIKGADSQWLREYYPYCGTWLNRRRWEDPHPEDKSLDEDGPGVVDDRRLQEW